MNSMEETDDSSRNDMMQRIQFSFSSNPLQRYPFQNQSPPSNPFSNPSQIRSSALLRHLPQSDASTANKRGIPPVSPYRPPSPAQNPPSGGGGPNPQPCHTRSLSQPAFYSFDSFPPLSPSPYKDSSSPSPSATSDPVSADVSMDDGGSRDALPPSPAPLPPRKAAHRRSLSEVSFSFPGLGGAAAPPPLPRPFDRPNPSAKLVKQESSDWEKDVGDRGDPKSDEDLFAAYMNLEQIDTLNSSGTDDKREDLDSRASGSRTNGVDSSDNEAESSLSTQRGGNPSPNVSNNHHKRSHAGGDVGAPRHCRSISMDSFIMGKMNFGEESPNIPPSPGPRLGQHSHSNSMDGVTNSTFSLDFGNGEFSTSDLKKIMANEKLAEMAMVDPKRVKRILANRQSAARSKERKMRYISELEQKVQTLQTEATTLSAQLTLLQRDSAGLTNQNNELKFRLQAMEQQAQLRDALNEALTAEVQRLKLATAELGDSHSNSLNHHVSTNNQFFQMQQQQQQSSQPSVYQLQQQQQQHLSSTAANESKS